MKRTKIYCKYRNDYFISYSQYTQKDKKKKLDYTFYKSTLYNIQVLLHYAILIYLC